ncbi:MAG TPA: GFA family protein [Woeseiaceae bacterium]|nr:GFA family protein [Woeseiaceae bacterium]
MSAADKIRHTGHCFCGAVEVEATGAPFAMGYCHCKDCRAWSAGPVNAFTLWQPDDVKVTKGADKLVSYSSNGSTFRKFCGDCGGNVLSDHPGMEFTDIFAALLPTLSFEPALHVNYGSSVLRIRDGLPKLKDFPAEMGGSGETLPE